MTTGWFDNELDAYRTAIGIAIAAGLLAEAGSMGGVTTKYNVGSLDRGGQLRVLVTALQPDARQRPYAYAERLAEAGIEYMAKKLVDEELMLSDVLGAPDAVGAGGVET